MCFSRNEIAVSCWKQNRIVVLDLEGNFMRSHTGLNDGPGGGVGKLAVPSGVAWRGDGRLYVSELGGSRIRVFADCDGTPAR